MYPKSNLMALEDLPTRDVEHARMLLARATDVRYMRNLLNFTDILRSPNCNEEECPSMRQRWDRHLHDHHTMSSSNRPSVLHTISPPIKVRDQAISASSTLSQLRMPTFITQQDNDARAAQTDLTSDDLSRLDHLNKYLTKKLAKPLPCITYRDNTPIKEGSATLKISRTRSVIPERSFYKEHLNKITGRWLEDMPMYSTMTDKEKEIQDYVLNNLVEKVYKLAVDAGNQSYEAKVKLEIDDCLKKLPMWSPGAESDNIQFNTGIRDNLWFEIEVLNRKYLVNTESNIEINECSDINDNEANHTNTPENEVIVDANQNESIVAENMFVKEIIIDWLNNNTNNEDINRFSTAEFILKHLEPLLNESLHNATYKLLLKGKIFDALEALPLNSSAVTNKILYFNRCAEELANMIISKRLKSEIIPYLRENTEQNALINRIEKVSDCLGSLRMNRLVDIEEEIFSTIMDDVFFHNNDEYATNKPNNSVSSQIDNVSGAKEKNNYLESSADVDKNTVTLSYHTMAPQLSGILSVFTSKEYSFAATSTPKKAIKKDIPKLNAEEITYMDKVAELITSWIETLPKQYNEDENFKKTVIYDLAGDVMDELKLKELSPEIKSDGDKYLTYTTFKWLCKFDFFENINDAKPLVKDFVAKLKNIPIPKFTRPQHGNRQTMQNIKHMQSEMANEDFIPQGIDVLEDQISVWMNEQPSEIYVKKNKGARNKQVHDLALNLQDKLRNKSPDSEIVQDINDWLKNVVKPKEKEHIGILSENLKEKIKNTPQDETLGLNVQKMKRERQEYIESRRQGQPEVNNKTNETKLDTQDLDKTMHEFIMKFMEHNYDIDDPMARGAFSHLLKIELRKLTPQTRKEVYENLSKSNPHEEFLPSKLNKELEYIKLISDWLKNIPIAASYNTVGNKDRVDFVNDLARNIAEAEEQRQQDPSQMDFDEFILSIISQSMRTYEIPILPQHYHNEKLMADELMYKIIAARTPDSTICSYTDSSIKDDTFNIKQNLSEFIEQYVRLNGREIADDEVKLEAWSARLLKEIKKMIHENEDPNTLSKAQVYNRFVDVPIPGDESVRLFGLELEYVKEISEWLKNLPLMSIANQPDAQNKRIEMISDLAEKMSERTVQKAASPNDSKVDSNTVEYVTNWISKLPLDPQHEIVLPLVIHQLINRIDRVNKKANPIDSSMSQNLDESKKKDNSTKSPKERPKERTNKIHQDPGKVVVEAIEHFSNKLPLQGDKEAVTAMKDNIAKKLYQKIGELNVDPRVFNDDLLYQEMFEDEIDTQLENVPQNSDLQNQREKLKSGLIDTILDAKKSAKANAAGENYKHKLETTIDGSIPNPHQSNQEIDPGFEIYKNQVANMFILQNFDHGNDETKAKYEKMIRNEIDKYSKNAQNKNAAPMTKDQLYNELYSKLFKVPIPSGKAVTDEVEEVKMRYELQTWFDSLPLREPSSTSELLERDKIVTTLAKRIHEMEKESKSNEKIRNEATKWLNKLPLQPGQDKNIDEFVKNLQSTLKSTAADRKCVTTEPKTQDTKVKPKKSKGILGTSKIAGPSSAGEKWISPPNSPKTTELKTQEMKVKPKKSKGILGTSKIAGPSSAGEKWISPPNSPETKPCCIKLNQQKPAEALIEIIEKWCQAIPLVSSEVENKIMKDNLSTRITIKIIELNTNPEFFDNDMIYCDLLDEELDNLLINLPIAPEFENSIPAKKYQLIEELKSIKPFMKEEKAKHVYKEDLKNTVSTILKEPQTTSEDKLVLYNELKNDIIENFVQYNYDREDELRQLYIQHVHDDVVKYLKDYREQATNNQDPLIVRNQLMCELSKIPIPSIGAIKETVEEIKMKKEVDELFENLPSSKGDAQTESLRKQFKVSLSKRLYDIEKSGHSCSTDKKMKSEISKSLKKQGIEENSEIINSFVDKLRSNEGSRKALPNPQTISLLTTGADNIQMPNYRVTDQTGQSPENIQDGINSTKHSQNRGMQNPYQNITGPQIAQFPNQMVSNQNQMPSQRPQTPQVCSQCPDRNQVVERSQDQFTNSLRPPPYEAEPQSSVPQQDPRFFNTFLQRRSIDQEFSPAAQRTQRSLIHSDVNYDDFRGRIILNSSLVPNANANEQPDLPNTPLQSIIQGNTSNAAPVPTSPPTPSNLLEAPRFSPINTGPPAGRRTRSQPSCDALRFLMGEYPQFLNSDGVCICVKRILKSCKGGPQCDADMNEFCEECGGYGPMWWRMAPGFYFY